MIRAMYENEERTMLLEREAESLGLVEGRMMALTIEVIEEILEEARASQERNRGVSERFDREMEQRIGRLEKALTKLKEARHEMGQTGEDH